MPDIDVNPFENVREISIGELHAMTAPFARYEAYEDPEVLLRKGLIEETLEFLNHAEPTNDTEHLKGELGDIIWYCSEIARSRGIDLAHPDQDTSLPFLDDYQRNPAVREKVLPLQTKQEIIDRDYDAETALAASALRVVDAINPHTPAIWEGTAPDQRTLDLALRDLVVQTGIMAQRHRLSLSECITHTVDKLKARERSPHVIDEANSSDQVTSGRYRLEPWVANLIVDYLKHDEAVARLFNQPDSPRAHTI